MKKIIVLLLSFSLTACVSPQYCTPEAAYEKGVADAQKSQSMLVNYAAYCPNDMALQMCLNAHYRAGYQAALADNRERILPAKPYRHSKHHHKKYYRYP